MLQKIYNNVNNLVHVSQSLLPKCTLSACEPMDVIIQRRFINFANSIHNNEVLSTIANVAKNNPFSTFGYNYANSITNHINEWYSNNHAG